MTNAGHIQQLKGVLLGLKDDYEAGMLYDLSHLIEVNITTYYMGQAEQLLGEGVSGQLIMFLQRS